MTKREQAAMILGLIASQRMAIPSDVNEFQATSINGIAMDFGLTGGIGLAHAAFAKVPHTYGVNTAENWADEWAEAESMVRDGWSPT